MDNLDLLLNFMENLRYPILLNVLYVLSSFRLILTGSGSLIDLLCLSLLVVMWDEGQLGERVRLWSLLLLAIRTLL